MGQPAVLGALNALKLEDDARYIIRPIPGRGLASVATSMIPTGTRILAEPALFKIRHLPENARVVADKQLINALGYLNMDQRRAFLGLQNCHGGIGARILVGLIRTNAFRLGSGAIQGGIFLRASRINHACRPNAQQTWNANLDRLTIHAIRDIREGEEITISYLNGPADSAERQIRLRTAFRFNCACEFCMLSGEQRQESNRRQEELVRLDGLVGNIDDFYSKPLARLHNAHARLRLLEEEGMADVRVARLYHDAFEVAITNADVARAKVLAGRAYAANVICEGEDSPESIKLKAFAEDPTKHLLYGTSVEWLPDDDEYPEILDEEQCEDWLWRKGTVW